MLTAAPVAPVNANAAASTPPKSPAFDADGSVTRTFANRSPDVLAIVVAATIVASTPM